MATILFTWELGQGLGHLAPLRPLCQQLTGHNIYLVARDLRHSHRLFSQLPVQLLQAPFFHDRDTEPADQVFAFGQLLNNCGFASVARLSGLFSAWRNIYRLVMPDLIVCDHSPIALLAARGLGVPVAILGSGFMCPPPEQPLGVFFPNDTTERRAAAIANSEANVLRTANEVLSAAAITELPNLGSLYAQPDRVLLTTFAEFDHFPQRPSADYQGLRVAGGGEKPIWPAAPGKRIFAYLKPFPKLAALLESLRRAAQPTLVYGSDLPSEMLRAYSGKTLKLGTRPLDLDAVAAQADFAILNGNHATCGQLLLRGVPALNIPLQREQQLFSHRAAATGACLTALPEDVDHMVECLNALAEDNRFRAAAAQFASEKSDFDIASVPSALAAELTALL